MQEYNLKTAEIVRIIEITEIIVQHNIVLSPELKSALAQCEEVFQARLALDILINSKFIGGPNYMTAENISLLVKHSMHAKKIAGAFVRLEPEYYADVSNRVFICESEVALKIELAHCINELGQAGILEGNRETLKNADYKVVRNSAKILSLLNAAQILAQDKYNDLMEKQKFLEGMLVVLKKIPGKDYWRIWDGLCEYAHIFNESEIREKISEVKQLDRQIFEEFIKIFQQSSQETIVDKIEKYLVLVKDMQAHDIRLMDNLSLNFRGRTASITPVPLEFNRTGRELLSIVSEEDTIVSVAVKEKSDDNSRTISPVNDNQAQLLLSYKQSHFAPPKESKSVLDLDSDAVTVYQAPDKST